MYWIGNSQMVQRRGWTFNPVLGFDEDWCNMGYTCPKHDSLPSVIILQILTSGRYTYIHDAENGFSEAVDQHHILVQRSKARKFLLYFVTGLFLAYICHLLAVKEPLSTSLLLIISLAVILVRSSYRSSVERESVIIMPSLGVQLVTHYMSGSTERRFVPIGKVLKPLLNECVTPVTCYWSLALLVRGEPELMLVFQKLQPPVKMLIPVWKALCSAPMGEQNVRK